MLKGLILDKVSSWQDLKVFLDSIALGIFLHLIHLYS